MDESYTKYKQEKNIGVRYTSPVFGPIHSRRLGISLGINLLPADGKWCSFDCIYCECGLNKDNRAKESLPTMEEVISKLEAKILELKGDGIVPDVLTFAGNGEPTLHPDFPAVVDGVIRIRNQYCPNAKVSILSNSTQIHRKEICEALLKLDNNILKLDTVSPEYINMVDRPNEAYSMQLVIDSMKLFDGNLIVQTMFMTGVDSEGRNVDNTGDEYVLPYIETLKEIAPRQVMIYTIDRETPVQSLRKASHEQLDGIAEKIRKAGIEVSISY